MVAREVCVFEGEEVAVGVGGGDFDEAGEVVGERVGILLEKEGEIEEVLVIELD